MAEVVRFEEETPLPNHYERWHINTSYRDLYRAGEHLALAIGDERFGNFATCTAPGGIIITACNRPKW